MLCQTLLSNAGRAVMAGRRLAAVGGVLAIAGAAFAEATVASSASNSTQTQVKNITDVKADKAKNGMWAERAKLVQPDEGAVQAFYQKQVGPLPEAKEVEGLNQFEQAVFCGICDFDAPVSRETALPAAWSEYGDAFFNRADAVAGNWLRDQGCFVIAACAGVTNPANKLKMPIAFDYTSSLPNFKICGFISNFNAPNDPGTASSLFVIQPDPSGNTFTPSPQCGTFTPTLQNNQRDRDMIRFTVPPGGISNFRIFITCGQEFIASLGVNKNFPDPGTINSCWTDANNTDNPPAEFGFIAVIGGDRSATNPDSTTGDGPEGAINSTWAFPRGGTFTIAEGEYNINIQLKAFASLVPPSVATPPSTRYQIQIVGTPAVAGIGACCVVGSDTCTDSQTNAQCDALNGVWRGAGTTCSAINAGTVPCFLPACSGTAEGASRDCPAASDQNLGCVVTNSTLFDFINAGETICGFSGGDIVGTVDDTDEDWFLYENASANNESVKFTLDTEHRSAFQFFYGGPDTGNPCAGVSGFGFNPGEPVRGSEIEVCIPPGRQVFVRLVPAEIPLPCGNPNGPRYKLTLTVGACNQVACCSLAGVCTTASGLDCYAGGGISLGEGSTCATSTCCSGTAVCTGSTANENSLPFSGGRVGSSDVCITNANFATFTDTFNGGCENTATVFCNATVGQKICGTLNSFNQVGDTDWYQVTTIGADAYLGVILKGQMDMDVELYRKPTGVICPATFADLAPNLLQSGTYVACDATSTIIGDCLPAGTYYIRVISRFSNFYEVPCVSNAPAANYLMEIFQGVCTGTQVACTGTAENETNCQNTNTNGGCNTEPTPNFGAIACNGTVCGTADFLAGIRDTDWYQISHPGGAFTVNFQSAFYGFAIVAKPGTPSACDDLEVVDGREFINPNTPTSFTIASLAAGTYWVIVGPDFDGTKRVCCNSASNYRLNVACTPACACFFDLVGNDCIVNVADLTAFLGQFGKTCAQVAPAKCADSDNNGVVNVSDLTAFLGQFGKNGNVNPGVCQ